MAAGEQLRSSGGGGQALIRVWEWRFSQFFCPRTRRVF
uniref:Uncharacterized protein n=1 Tax=Arundo donax TaxID=35708 RepID=A0A0A8ZAM2_ARUDO